MPEKKVDKIEYSKRIRIVQEWLIEDWPSTDIIMQIFQKWGVGERQAKRYISVARQLWVSDEQAVIEQRRKFKVQSLKKLKRSLLDRFKGTPAGIRAIIAVEKEIIKLENLRPPVKVLHSGDANGEPIKISVIRK
jgi:hypothetical protein